MIDADFTKTIALFQKVSLNRLEWLIGSHKVELVESADSKLCAFERWLCLVQLSHQEFRFILKCHFGDEFCSFLQNKPTENSDLAKCFDQVREVCNLIIGGVKLSLNDMRVGVSLPLILGGFDEIFLRLPTDQLTFFSVWSFKSDRFQIYFSLEALVFNEEVIQILNAAADLNSQLKTGEAEFF